MSSYRTPSPPESYVTLDDYTADSACSSPEPSYYFPDAAPSPALSAVSLHSPSPHARSLYEQQCHDEKLRSVFKLGGLPLNLNSLPLLFPNGRGKKPRELVRYPIKLLISLAIRSSPRQALTLNQIYEAVELNLAVYRHVPGEMARDRVKRTRWQSSVRHSLSLQCMFQKVDRLPGVTNEKLRGDWWTLDPYQFGKSRRTKALAAKKKAMVIVEEKRKRPSRAKSSPTKPCPKARPHPSPSMSTRAQQYQPSPSDHDPQIQGAYSFTNFPHAPCAPAAHPRGLFHVPPIDQPFTYLNTSSFHPVPLDSSRVPGGQFSLSPLSSLEPGLDHSYSQYGQYPQLSQYSCYDSRVTIRQGYDADQGISPALLHAPIPTHSQESQMSTVIHGGRSLRMTASRKRRDALIPC